MTTSESIRIGGVDYVVVEDSLLHDMQMVGQIRFLRCEIALAPGLHPEARKQALLHEIVHGLLTHAGIREQGENVVDAVAHGLMQVVRDNPQLFKK